MMFMRKCWNWQTGKTKDLVTARPCGFKSHLPHEKNLRLFLRFFCFCGMDHKQLEKGDHYGSDGYAEKSHVS